MKNKLAYRTVVFLILLFGILLISISNISALNQLSNESINAKNAMDQAEKDISEMISKNISIKRVNETYQEALQLYSAQLSLEEKGGRANYKLVNEYASKIDSIKKTALEANDELRVFLKNYEDSKKKANLSEMQSDYNQIILSFNEERFEDTLKSIKKGYDRISEIQSSQTAINSIYLVTSRSIKNFFIKNGIKIIVIIAIVFILLLIFWNSLIKLKMRIKLNNLIIQKNAVNGLIKEMQKNYFKTRKISESEYKIKLKRYEELIRDIDRQIMILKEEIFKKNLIKQNKKFKE